MGPAAAAAAIGRMEGEGHDERERVVKRKLAYRGSEVGVGMRKMKRYRGRLSSRAEMDIEPGVFEVNGGDGGEDDDDDEEIESEGFESESEVEEEEGDGGMGKVGVAETEEEKLEREVGELEKEERIAARNLGKERRADVVKGKAVREQKVCCVFVCFFVGVRESCDDDLVFLRLSARLSMRKHMRGFNWT